MTRRARATASVAGSRTTPVTTRRPRSCWPGTRPIRSTASATSTPTPFPTTRYRRTSTGSTRSTATARSPTDQHHLLIIGHDGPNLKVFDPNAPTHERVYWVSSEDFTSGNVQGAPVTSIRVPHG